MSMSIYVFVCVSVGSHNL